MRMITREQRKQFSEYRRRIEVLRRQEQELAEEASAMLGVAPNDAHLFDVVFNDGNVDVAIGRMGFAVAESEQDRT